MLLQPRQRTFLAVWCIPVRVRGSIAAEWAVSCIHLKSNNAGGNVVRTDEKELLACDKFDAHVYGHQFVIIETDHKPLEPIFTKLLTSAPKHMKMLLRIQKYSLHVNLQESWRMYRPLLLVASD